MRLGTKLFQQTRRLNITRPMLAPVAFVCFVAASIGCFVACSSHQVPAVQAAAIAALCLVFAALVDVVAGPFLRPRIDWEQFEDDFWHHVRVHGSAAKPAPRKDNSTEEK